MPIIKKLEWLSDYDQLNADYVAHKPSPGTPTQFDTVTKRIRYKRGDVITVEVMEEETGRFRNVDANEFFEAQNLYRLFDDPSGQFPADRR